MNKEELNELVESFKNNMIIAAKIQDFIQREGHTPGEYYCASIISSVGMAMQNQNSLEDLKKVLEETWNVMNILKKKDGTH